MKLRILGHDVEVVYAEPGIAKDTFGSWDRGTMTITISSCIHKSDQAATLLHEVVHAVADLLDIDLSEAVVAGLSQGLYAAIVDNPEMFKEDFKGEPT